MVRCDKFEKQCDTCAYGENTDYCPETDCQKCPMYITGDEAVIRKSMCRCLDDPDVGEKTCKYYKKMEEDKQ